MRRDLLSWSIFVALSFIWGSSFILMKLGLHRLTPYQVAAIRIVSSGLVLSPIATRSLRKIPKQKLLIVFLSGSLGNLIPAFLFCLAEQRIDSALTGTINCLTPIFVIVTGTLFFNLQTSFNKIIGVVIAFLGTTLLFIGKSHLHGYNEMIDVGYVVFATILYGFNVNMVHRQLKNIPSMQIASVALFLNGLLAFVILFCTGYFNLSFSDKDVLLSTGAAAVLGTFGTAIATIIFYILIKRAGAVFSSLVTYGMPFIAIFWGFVVGEDIGWAQISCLVLILIGVYWANRNRSD
jgi:drug/metabolite transporter (DMT)-like permease